MNSYCAICLNYGPALRPQQFCEDGPIFLICALCNGTEHPTIRRHPPRYIASGRRNGDKAQCRYLPLDEAERGLSYRILRAIRHFDWISSPELSELLGIPSFTDDHTARNNYSVALSRLARGGCLDRRYVLEWAEYRINRCGLARIESTQRAAVEDKRSIAA